MKPKVLFLCTGNSARSQMAEGLLRHYAGNDYEVLSAGTHPAEVNPLAIEVMEEIGVDISRQTSKNVSTFLGANIPYVVTVCDRAKESCPIFPGAFKILSWSFDDPAAIGGSKEERLAAFRRVRDELAECIRKQFVTVPSASQKV
jgi:arsenate reductase